MDSNLVLNTLSSGSYIAVNKKLLYHTSGKEAIVLSELLSRYKYFADRGQLTEDGFFYNTAEDLQDSVMFSRTTQWRAINKLVKRGLLEEKIQDFPAKRYFKPNFKAILELMES